MITLAERAAITLPDLEAITLPDLEAITLRGLEVITLPALRHAADQTTVWTRQDGVVAVVLTVDGGCRSVPDITATKSRASGPVLESVERAVEAAFGTPEGVPAGMELRRDQRPQYTGHDAAALVRRSGIQQTFAPVVRPTGNAAAERTIQTMKVECLWLSELEDVLSLKAALDTWRTSFNE